MFDRNFTSTGDADEWVADCQDPTESSQRAKHVQLHKDQGLIPNTYEHRQRLREEGAITVEKPEKKDFVSPSTHIVSHKIKNTPGKFLPKSDDSDGRMNHKLPAALNDRWKTHAKFQFGNTRSKNKLLIKLLDCLDADPMFMDRV